MCHRSGHLETNVFRILQHVYFDCVRGRNEPGIVETETRKMKYKNQEWILMIEYLPSINATNLQFSGKNVLNISREIFRQNTNKELPAFTVKSMGEGTKNPIGSLKPKGTPTANEMRRHDPTSLTSASAV